MQAVRLARGARSAQRAVFALSPAAHLAGRLLLLLLLLVLLLLLFPHRTVGELRAPRCGGCTLPKRTRVRVSVYDTARGQANERADFTGAGCLSPHPRRRELAALLPHRPLSFRMQARAGCATRCAQLLLQPVQQQVAVPLVSPHHRGLLSMRVVAERPTRGRGQPQLSIWRLLVHHKGALPLAQLDGQYPLLSRRGGRMRRERGRSTRRDAPTTARPSQASPAPPQTPGEAEKARSERGTREVSQRRRRSSSAPLLSSTPTPAPHPRVSGTPPRSAALARPRARRRQRRLLACARRRRRVATTAAGDRGARGTRGGRGEPSDTERGAACSNSIKSHTTRA